MQYFMYSPQITEPPPQNDYQTSRAPGFKVMLKVMYVHKVILNQEAYFVQFVKQLK